MAQADGSVLINVNLDSSDADKELSELKAKIEKTEQVSANYQKKRNELAKQELSVSEKLEKQKKKIGEAEKQIAAIQNEQDAARQKELFGAAELDNEKMKLEEIKDRLQELRTLSKDKSVGTEDRDRYTAMLPGVKEELSDQQIRVHGLQSEYNKTAESVVRYDDKLKEARNNLESLKSAAEELQGEHSKVTNEIRISDDVLRGARDQLESMTTKAGELQQKINAAAEKTKKLDNYAKKADKAMGRFGRRLKSVVAGALVFNVVSAGMRKFVEWGGKVIKSNDKAQAAIAKLKGALLTLAQPLVEVLIPAFTTFVQILSEAAAAAAALVSKLFGKTAEQSAEAAKNLNAEMEALEGVNSASKKAGKAMASFDEINQVGGGEKDQGTSGGIAPDFGGALASMEAQILTSMGLVAIGALLTFTGNILIGIGMIALGAYGLFSAAQEDPETVKTMLSGWLGQALVIAGVVAVALGLLLAFTGHVLLGVGLIAFGAAAIATEATLAPDAIKDMLTSWLGGVLVIAGMVAVVLGLILLAIPSHMLLGVGLIALGAAALVTAIAFNWEEITNMLKGQIGAITAVVSTALLALGAILTFSGVGIPIGIALMAAGAVGLAASVAANWDTIVNFIKENIETISTVISAATLAIGAILTFSGINMLVGIPLLAAGAAGLISAVTANWNAIEEALQGPIGAVVGIISGALIVLGIILVASGVGIPLGLGLLLVGAAGMAATVKANWDYIIDALQGPIGDALAIASGALLVLGIILLFTGAGIPLGLGLIAAGAAGLVAAIAPNWNTILDALKAMWAAILAWWNGVVVPAFQKVGRVFADYVINPLLAAVEGFINFFIKGINFLIDKINSVSFDVPDWVPGIGGTKFGFNLKRVTEISLPRLAQGAVIPPNREFMAVLGDQKSGTNIETPLETMVQAFRQAMSESGGGGRNITVILELDRREFGRAVYKANNEETQRVGVRLAGVRA